MFDQNLNGRLRGLDSLVGVMCAEQIEQPEHRRATDYDAFVDVIGLTRSSDRNADVWPSGSSDVTATRRRG